jgi:tellurite resistance protein
MRQLIEGVRGKVGKLREDSRYREFVDAAMAACVLVALADEDHRLSELTARDRVLHHMDQERSIDVKRAVATYERYTQLLQTDRPSGKRTLLDVIAALKPDPAAAERLVRVCLTVGHADQQFSARERAVVEDICEILGLHPGDIGVYDI